MRWQWRRSIEGEIEMDGCGIGREGGRENGVTCVKHSLPKIDPGIRFASGI